MHVPLIGSVVLPDRHRVARAPRRRLRGGPLRVVVHAHVRAPDTGGGAALGEVDVRIGRLVAVALVAPDGVGVVRSVHGDGGIPLRARTGVVVHLLVGAPRAGARIAAGEVEVPVRSGAVGVPDEVARGAGAQRDLGTVLLSGRDVIHLDARRPGQDGRRQALNVLVEGRAVSFSVQRV